MTILFSFLWRSPFPCAPCLCFSKTFFFLAVRRPAGAFFFCQNSHLEKMNKFLLHVYIGFFYVFKNLFFSLIVLSIFYRALTSIIPLIVQHVFHKGIAYVSQKLVSCPYRIVKHPYRFTIHPIYDRHGNFFRREKA